MRDGGGVPSDFVNVWAAGRMALAGHAVLVYDWPAHKLVEESAVGHGFDGYFGWHYPPTFLFVAAALSLIPYADRVGHLDLRHLSRLPRGDPHHHRGSRWLFPRRRVPRGAGKLHRRPERIPHRRAHRRRAHFDRAATGVSWRPYRAADLQASSRLVVSDRAHCRRALARVRHRHGRCGADGGRARGSPSAARAGMPSSPASATRRRRFFPTAGRIGASCKPRFGLTRTLGGSETLAWTMQIAVALIAAVGVAIVWRSRAGRTDQGRGARVGSVAGDAISLHVRPRRAGGAAGVSLPSRLRARFLRNEAARDRCRLPLISLSLHQVAGRVRRHRHRGRTDRPARVRAAERRGMSAHEAAPAPRRA